MRWALATVGVRMYDPLLVHLVSYVRFDPFGFPSRTEKVGFVGQERLALSGRGEPECSVRAELTGQIVGSDEASRGEALLRVEALRLQGHVDEFWHGNEVRILSWLTISEDRSHRTSQEQNRSVHPGKI